MGCTIVLLQILRSCKYLVKFTLEALFPVRETLPWTLVEIVTKKMRHWRPRELFSFE